jgi:hypothetical protein
MQLVKYSLHRKMFQIKFVDYVLKVIFGRLDVIEKITKI